MKLSQLCANKKNKIFSIELGILLQFYEAGYIIYYLVEYISVQAF